MNRLIVAAFLLGTIVSSANAMPLAPTAPVQNPDIIEVVRGCGPG